MISRINIVLSICFMALIMPFSVQADDDNSHKIYELPAHKIASYIKEVKGQRRIIIIYASWCPYCIKKMPHIMDLERIKEGSVIAISVDENKSAFARYIKKFDEIPFRIILNKGSEWKLAKSLKKFGVKPWEGVPEIILLDENNKAMGQGNYELDYVAEFLFGKKT